MEIKTEIGRDYFLVEVSTDLHRLKNDITELSKERNFVVPQEFINDLLDTASSASLFNKKTSVEFVKYVYDNYLSDSKKQEFIKQITNK